MERCREIPYRPPFRQLKPVWSPRRTRNLADTTPWEVQFDNRMIKQDIVDGVVNRTGLSQTKAAIAVETVFETMKRSMERGERIELRGFGVFTIRPRKTGIGRNPKTGEEVAIPPGNAVRFKPGKGLRPS